MSQMRQAQVQKQRDKRASHLGHARSLPISNFEDSDDYNMPLSHHVVGEALALHAKCTRTQPPEEAAASPSPTEPEVRFPNTSTQEEKKLDLLLYTS